MTSTVMHDRGSPVSTHTYPRPPSLPCAAGCNPADVEAGIQDYLDQQKVHHHTARSARSGLSTLTGNTGQTRRDTGHSAAEPAASDIVVAAAADSLRRIVGLFVPLHIPSIEVAVVAVAEPRRHH